MTEGTRRATRRGFIAGAAMAATAAIGYLRMPSKVMPPIPEEAFDSLIPNRIASWSFETASGLVLPPPDQLSDRLYDNLVTRTYGSSNNLPVMLLAAYNNSQDGVVQLHRPEVCYPAGGYTLSESRDMAVELAPGRTLTCKFFTATSEARVEHIAYWTRLGADFPTSWADQRLAVVRANLKGDVPDGLLVRVSTLAQEPGEAMETLSNFIRGMASSMGEPGRKLLFRLD